MPKVTQRDTRIMCYLLRTNCWHLTVVEAPEITIQTSNDMI